MILTRKSIVAQYDTDGSGEIEFPEFCNMMSQKMSQQDDAEMVKLKIMRMILLVMMVKSVMIIIMMMVTIRNRLDINGQVRLAFRTLDKDGSGTIETSEFKHLMTHIGKRTTNTNTNTSTNINADKTTIT